MTELTKYYNLEQSQKVENKSNAKIIEFFIEGIH